MSICNKRIRMLYKMHTISTSVCIIEFFFTFFFFFSDTLL